MKNLKKLLLLLLALSISVALFACSGKSGTGDLELIEDGEANFRFVLGEEIPTDIRIELDKEILPALAAQGITVECAQQGTSSDKEQDVEVLIGNVTNRGDEYIFDRYDLGAAGYMIKIVGEKVVIQAGSDEVLYDALMEFATRILKIKSDSKNITMLVGLKTDKDKKGDEVYYVHSGYDVSSLSVDSTDMKGYTIAADSENAYYAAAAELIQETVYESTGYYFEIVSLAEATDKSIILQHIDRKTVSGTDTFTVETDGTKLVISCAYDNKLEEKVNEFLSEYIILAEGDVDFSGRVMEKDISVVSYEDFYTDENGVKTDNDFIAMYRAHAFANISGQTVVAKPGKTYYIFDTSNPDNEIAPEKDSGRTITIQTNVDWQGAKFIIDDTDIGLHTGEDYKGLNTNIFKIIPDNDLAAITLKASNPLHAEYIKTILGDGINPNSTRIEIPKEAMDGWEGPVMLNIKNSSHKIFRRRGYSKAAGGDMTEVVYVNADGTIELGSEYETPIIFDYQQLSEVTIYRLDESTAITVQNGTFTTRACRTNTILVNDEGNLETFDTYVSRGISINRSYTTLYNIKHYVENEVKFIEQVDENGNIVRGGAPYSGFYNPSGAHHIIIDTCILSGHRCYARPNGSGHTGTYDLGGSSANYLIYKNCVQHNFWVTINANTSEISSANEGDVGAKTSMSGATINLPSGKTKSFGMMHWGIGGTNRCKNLYYDNSTLSRFDAHEGLYNGGIINGSTVNYIELIGNGTFEFTDSRLFTSGNNVLLPLRSDYGWTWNGEMIVKNVDAFMYTNKTIGVTYFGYNNWYFGYTCSFPSISLDNVDFYDIAAYYADFSKIPVAPGTEIWLTNTEIVRNSRMHLATSHTNPIYSIEDRDGDGFIDEPSFDHDGDGVVDDAKNFDLDGKNGNGNTDIDYKSHYNNGKYDGSKSNKGVPDSDSYVNLCRVIPPEYIRIVNNDGVNGGGGYRYVIWDTSGYQIPDTFKSDGNLGGFFGATKFIYGDGENEYFLGTNYGDKTATTPFLFRK